MNNYIGLEVRVKKLMDDGPVRFAVSSWRGDKMIRELITASFQEVREFMERVLNQ